MLSTILFLFLLPIFSCSIVADDSSSFKPQDLTYPLIPSSSDADAFQTVTDPDLSPEVLLAGSENNLADCQSAPPSSRTRRSRLWKRQTGFCSWQPFKSGAPTTQTPQASPQNGEAGATGHDGAGTPLVPTNKIGPVDVKNSDEDKAPVPIPFDGAKNTEICGPTKETIPVCHYSPEIRGSSRWLSPTTILIPVRLCRFQFPPPLSPSVIIVIIDGLTCGFVYPLPARCTWLHLHGTRRNLVLLLYLRPASSKARHYLS